MRESDLANYTNPSPQGNLAYPFALLLMKRAMTFTWHHVRYRFLPPVDACVVLKPLDPKHKALEEIDSELFAPNALLFDRPLNFYIRATIFGYEHPCSINAGYLATRFLKGDKHGYKALKDLVTFTKTHNRGATPATADAEA